MEWQLTPVIILYALAWLVNWALSIYAWQRRDQPGAPMLIVLTLGSGFWALGYGLGFFSADLPFKFAMIRVEYIGLVTVPTAWALFVFRYGKYDSLLKPGIIALFWVLPVVQYGLILFAFQHELIYRSYEYVLQGGLLVSVKEYGPFFWLFAAYAYILTIVASVMLIVAVARYPSLFRRQAGLMTSAALVPIIVNVLYITGNNPFAPYDPSSLAFTITGFLISVVVFRYGLLAVVPVAHSLVFENVNSAVVIINEEGIILELNPMAERVLGRAEQTILGKNVMAAFPEHLPLLERFRNINEAKAEITLGDAIYEMQITPILDEGGGLNGRIIMLYDITQQRHLIDELDAYARTVAHDLKNPVGVLRGYAQLIKTTDMSAEQRNAYLERIIVGSDKMENIIHSLLLLAQLRQADEVKTTPLATEPLVRAARERLEALIDEAGATLTLPETWPKAVGYGPWVEEVWVNYLSNAVKYGGSPPQIEVGAEAKGDMVRFFVRDNGAGLTKAEQERLFSEFARMGEHQSSIEGHGLGLSIVARIMAQLKGSVGCESTPGTGSTFWFSLPKA